MDGKPLLPKYPRQADICGDHLGAKLLIPHTADDLPVQNSNAQAVGLMTPTKALK